ncbi:MAG: DNA polymerase III subunit beta, partial [Metamycoplasmataceae bacterium]
VIIKTKNIIGDDLIFTVNYKYLKEAIAVFEGEIQLKFNKGIERFVIIGKSNPKNKQLIAPQRSY